MTDVRVRLFRDGPAGDKVPALGVLAWTPSRRRDAPVGTVVPAGFAVILDPTGTTVVPGVDATTDDWCWEIVERDVRGGTTRFVAVPDSATVVDYEDLPEVDPGSLLPTAVPEAAWWAVARSTVSGGTVEDGHLILTRTDGVQVDAGPLPPGPEGNPGAGIVGGTIDGNGDLVLELADGSFLPPVAVPPGPPGAAVELRATETAIEWRVGEDAWSELVPLSTLQGEPGGVGDPGPSAYDVAVAGGFVGTESEWLSTLQGEPGDPATPPAFTTDTTTGAPGTSADVELSGTYPNLNLGFTIPRGDQGEPGDPGPSGQAGTYVDVVTITGTTYTIAASDVGKLLRFTSADPVTITLPADAAAAILPGQTVDVVQRGAGSLTFVPGAGVGPLLVADTAVTRKVNSHATAIKDAPDVWAVVGDLV